VFKFIQQGSFSTWLSDAQAVEARKHK